MVAAIKKFVDFLVHNACIFQRLRSIHTQTHRALYALDCYFWQRSTGKSFHF